jgi:serine/threonine protein kinase
MQILFVLLAALAAIALLVVVVVFIIAPLFKLIGLGISHVFRFVGGMIGDSMRALGAVITMAIFVPFVILNIIIGRWSAAGHFGRSIQDECRSMGRSLYRVFVGHPAGLLLLRPMLEGVEQRVPQAMAHVPGADKPSRKTGSFDGYTVVGSLPAGGSGAKLYIAEPDERRLASFARQGAPGIDRVIIKSFSLKDGSSLPQIIRESRALEAAKKIGLVLEHELSEHRFYYVMPYVPGESMGAVIRRLHEDSGSGGLDDAHMREALGYVADLLKTIAAYHRAGLWHKDIKPDNIIVSDGEAHLVDLGLVTPLRSAMTLTTHGTEYFRDPEMVRMALKGVKVHEVDGAKFDVYATGAVLYSLLENQFPAHGGMSLLSNRCPEAVRWVVRRSMAEYNQRYASSYEMYADLEAVLGADDMFRLMPADLPSVRGGVDASAHDDPELDEATRVIAAGSPVAPAAQAPSIPPADRVAAAAPPPPMNAPPAPGERARPRLSLVNWWTGAYTPSGRPAPAARAVESPDAPEGWRPWREGGDGPLIEKTIPRGQRPSAEAQLRRARERAGAARQRAQRVRARSVRNRRARDRHGRQLNPGVGIALFLFLAATVGGAFALINSAYDDNDRRATGGAEDDTLNNAPAASEPASAESLQFMLDDLRELGGLRSIPSQLVEALADAGIYNEDSGVLTFEDRGSTITIKAPGWFRASVADQIGKQSGATGLALVSNPTPEPTPVPPLGRVLVYNSLNESADEATRESIRQSLDRLASLGYSVVGPGFATEDIDLTAAATKEIGLGTADDRATRDRLTAWLAGSRDNLQGLVWISRDRPIDKPLVLMHDRRSERLVERQFQLSR